MNTQSTQNTECEIFQLPEPEWRIHRIHIVHRIRNLPITRARVVNGVSSAGLTTQVQPAARAAATCFCIFKSLAQNRNCKYINKSKALRVTFLAGIPIGKFQGHT